MARSTKHAAREDAAAASTVATSQVREDLLDANKPRVSNVSAGSTGKLALGVPRVVMRSVCGVWLCADGRVLKLLAQIPRIYRFCLILLPEFLVDGAYASTKATFNSIQRCHRQASRTIDCAIASGESTRNDVKCSELETKTGTDRASRNCQQTRQTFCFCSVFCARSD